MVYQVPGVTCGMPLQCFWSSGFGPYAAACSPVGVFLGYAPSSTVTGTGASWAQVQVSGARWWAQLYRYVYIVLFGHRYRYR